MTSPPSRSPILLGSVVALALSVQAVSAAELTSAETQFFETKIRPALLKHCAECHSADSETLEGNFAVDTREAIRAGGDS